MVEQEGRRARQEGGQRGGAGIRISADSTPVRLPPTFVVPVFCVRHTPDLPGILFLLNIKMKADENIIDIIRYHGRS